MSESASASGRSLGELADLVGGEVAGDPSARVTGVASPEAAGVDDLVLLMDRRYVDRVAGSGAGALLVSRDLADAVSGHPARILVDDARTAMIPVVSALYPERVDPPGVHPTAVLGEDVHLGAGCSIGPYAVVEDGARIGDRSVLRSHVVVGRGATVGADCLLHPHAVLYDGVSLGDRVILQSGARVGVDGFGFVPGPAGPVKIPHVGTCDIEDDVEIGANSCVDRGSIGRTNIQRFSKLDNLVHIAHNVTVGSGSFMAALVGIAGSTTVGKGTLWAGQAGAVGHITIGDGVQVTAKTGVTSSHPDGVTLAGHPGRLARDYNKSMAAFYRLPDLRERLRRIERRLSADDESGDPAGE
jgi:UDP-3-O-[3-hydroxymyristoyl] glucosamine N-acyltransferase